MERNTSSGSPEDRNINALYELQDSKNAFDLIQHHRYVQEYYEAYNNNRELNHMFVRGFQYDPDELRRYRDKRKTPIVFNQVKTSERTILGHWINNKFAVKFSATSPDNDKLGEILEQLNIWESAQQKDSYIDVDLVRQAWAGGNSFQECYMDVKKGMKPVMRTGNQNPFAIYWDPESRKLISREDARFVDRATFWTLPALIKKWPKEKKGLKQQLAETKLGDEGYDETKIYADRGHEHRKERNGSYLVIERFFKVDGFQYFIEMGDTKVIIDKEDLKGFKEDNPGVTVQKESVHILHLAVVCEDYDNQEYLYNGPYHCQPRDPRTNEIIWPILEMVAEELAGEPQGFVDHERSPNKVINAMMSNIVSSATHSAAAAMLIDVSAFVSETEAKLAARHHSDSDRSFKTRPGRAKDAMLPIQHGQSNADHQYALDYSLNFLSEVSAAPPAMQGIQEGANTPGVLNAQRIQQGATQLASFMKNYQAFILQRAKLRYYYWREYNTAEMTFRVIDKSSPEMDPFMTINEMKPEIDAMGEWTGAIEKLNDINSAIYDMSIEESVDSPSYRAKQLAFIERMMDSKFIESDTGLAAGLLEEALRLADSPQRTREFLKKYSTLIQEAHLKEQQMKQQMAGAQTQGQEIANEQNMQQVANNEAAQTSPFPGGQGGAPQGQPSSPTNQQGVPT